MPLEGVPQPVKTYAILLRNSQPEKAHGKPGQALRPPPSRKKSLPCVRFSGIFLWVPVRRLGGIFLCTGLCIKKRIRRPVYPGSISFRSKTKTIFYCGSCAMASFIFSCTFSYLLDVAVIPIANEGEIRESLYMRHSSSTRFK